MSAGSKLPEVQQFSFRDHRYDPATGVATLAYAFDGGDVLEEQITFPYQPWPPDPSRQAAFMRALEILHLVAGVSYWKTCVPPRMETTDIALDNKAVEFLRALYTHGLAEFAWKNGIGLEDRVGFSTTGPGVDPFDLDLPDRSLLAMGGGKDSLVSLEVLRRAGHEFQPICVGGSKLIGDTVEAAGLPLIRIQRKLAPRLAEMNEAGALNGHVPVTAINSAILVCAALLYGYQNVIFSNESSANEATFTDSKGRVVNHQWSKSLEFEKGFRDLLAARVSPAVQYFSLLRPLCELAIAKQFSSMSQYHHVFSSCNRNFHIDGPRIDHRWCGDCPKCRFTSLALAPFMTPDEVAAAVGRDLLDQPEQEPGFRALCSLGDDKPLECIGSVDECRAAFCFLAQQPAWKDHKVVRALASEVTGREAPTLDELLNQRSPHCIPDPELVDALG